MKGLMRRGLDPNSTGSQPFAWRQGLGWRVWTMFIGVVILVGVGSAYGGYEIGRLTPTDGWPSTSPSTKGGIIFPAAAPIHNSVVDELKCKLPVYRLGIQGSGGFLSFPDGRAAGDPTSDVTAPGSEIDAGAPGDWFGLTYDAPAQRWLPVPTTWVSPDGAVYMYYRHVRAIELILVNARTGSSTSFGGVGMGGQVFGVTSTGAYFASPRGQGFSFYPYVPLGQGFNVDGGFWTAASGNFVYGTDIPDGGAVVRIDVRDRTQRVPWFNKSSTAAIIGFDGLGSPVIWTGSDLWIASSPSAATRIGSMSPPNPPTASGTPIHGVLAPVADAHGLWISATDGIYLFAGGQATKVSNLVAQVAGPCI